MSQISLDHLFENKDGKTITISLTTANKFLTKLKTHQSSEKETNEVSWGSNRKNKSNNIAPKISINKILMKYDNKDDHNIYYDDKNKITDDINYATKSVVDSYVKDKRIFWDITTIKNTIFFTNGQKGIDTILSKIELLNLMKSELSNIRKSLDGSQDFDLLIKMYKRSKDNNNNENINVDTFDKNNVQDTIKKINSMINELENKRDKLNATTEIEVFLSNDSLEILGI